MENLPEKITIGDRVFARFIMQAAADDEIFPNWWFIMYEPEDKLTLPAYVHNKHEWYYLASSGETKEEVIADMEERISTMIIDKQTIAYNIVKYDRTTS